MARAGGPALLSSGSATAGRSLLISGLSFFSQKKSRLARMVPQPLCRLPSPQPKNSGIVRTGRLLPSRVLGRGEEQRAKCQLYFCGTGHSGSPLPALFFPPFDEINYEHCPGSFDSGDTCQDKIFQKHLYLII